MAANQFLRLPREIRDRIYDEYFSIAAPNDPEDYRIERRHLRYFVPSPVTILLILGYRSILVNQQVAAEALKILFESHTPLFSVGPFVFKSFLERIEQESGKFGEEWLRLLKRFRWDWVTFPSLKRYYYDFKELKERVDPPEEEMDMGIDELWGEADGHNDEFDHEGAYYNDNMYGAGDPTLHSNAQRTNEPTPDLHDFSSHPSPRDYRVPEADESENGDWPEGEEVDWLIQDYDDGLDLLIANEVTPLFEYLSTPTFALDSITIPLYFMSQAQVARQPSVPRPSNFQFWIDVAVHAFLLLCPPDPATPPSLNALIIKYMPYDIKASLDPADDLERLVKEGIWFYEDDEQLRVSRWLMGDAIKGVCNQLWEKGVELSSHILDVDITLVEWDLNTERRRVGPELKLVFRRREVQEDLDA